MKWIVFLCLLAVYSVQAMPSKDEEEQAPVEEVAVESNNEEEEEVDGVKSRNKRSYPGDDPYPEPSGLDVDVNVNVNVPQGDIKADIDVNVNVNAGYNNWENGPSDDEDKDWEAFGEDKSKPCVWDKAEDFPENAPLLLNYRFHMVLPVMDDGQKIISVNAGNILKIACPEGKIKKLNKEAVEGNCVGGKLIKIDNKEWKMAQLGCSDKVVSSLKPNPGKCPGDQENGVYHVIGFNITMMDKFYEVIGVCFDPYQKTTIYSKNIIHGKNIAAKYVNNDRSHFITSSVSFGVDINDVYEKCSQKEQMLKLLKKVELAYIIFDECKFFYFEKGHMAPAADFVTKAEQDATYYYINAVPQWKTFNNGNWKQLETSTRELANELGTDLTVYTGTFNVLNLDVNDTNSVKIYLGFDKKESKEVVPAPALIWKVIHDEGREQAVAVVGINNPHINTKDIKLLCKDICAEIDWLKKENLEDPVRGYTYCCDVKELRKKITNIPDLGDVTLLKNSIKELSPEMESKYLG